MRDHELTDDQWAVLAPHLPPQRATTGRPAKAHRPMVEGILWRLRTGAPWRDLPMQYGPRGKAYTRASAGDSRRASGTRSWRPCGPPTPMANWTGSSTSWTARVSGRILVEAGPTQTIFTNPTDQRTEDYITGRFG